VAGIGTGERFQPATPADWRGGLAQNHARGAGVWLVTGKAAARP
jgi:hypothetical protein